MEVYVKFRIQKAIILSLYVIVILSLVLPAMSAMAADPQVVRAVLFYSPTCPACHTVITEVIPPLIEQYPNQLEIIGIDVTQEAGQVLYQSALVRFDVPDDRVGVPTLVVGALVMVGAKEIPEMFPGIIQQGIESGGIDWPDIPGLDQALAQVGYGQNSQETGTEVVEPTESTPNSLTMVDRFMLDPVANSIAVLMLIIMLFSVVTIGYRFLTGNPSGTNWPRWTLPLLSIIGLGISLYLSYIEFTHSEAFCGPVGDCNSVQTSTYAYLFGVIPVGIMGAVGYIAILIAWLIQEFGPSSLNRISKIAIWGMAWFGILFSIYLTFLEPFVIGATCAWCIGSAIIMTLILWVSTGPALDALQSDEDEDFSEDDDFEDGPEEDQTQTGLSNA